MDHPLCRLASRYALVTAFLLQAQPVPAQGTPIGFAEEFALATDRTKVLDQLIPGTPEYYYYHCLHRQNSGALAEVPALLEAWITRHGRGGKVEEIEIRQALLGYASDPAATFRFLRERLGLRFDAARIRAGAGAELPSRLDPALIAPAALARRALQLHPRSLDGFTASALPALAGTSLDDDLLQRLLMRLERPDVPNLPALVARNLQNPKSRGFGSLTIHDRLLFDQLEELVRLQPALLDHPRMVTEWLQRLVPTPDLDWRHDPAARAAYLDRLQAFVQRLSATHNSLKAHVLYHRLAHDLAAGAPDRERFQAFLRLPRRGSHVRAELVERVRDTAHIVEGAAAFPTGFTPIGDDEPLVRACLEHFLADADGYEAYAPWLDETYLRRVFAETKILLGRGDMERWYSLLGDPGLYEQLKERVEILFPPTQPTRFAAGGPVAIEVDLKNVPLLLVKVFAIDASAYLRATGKDVDASIDLDGMVGTEEQSHTYQDNALRRVRRRFEFQALGAPGTYVVEFLGNGRSSRAVIQKGRLQVRERIGAAGHVFTVYDEDGNRPAKATLWCNGREYAADERGAIVVPFTTEPGQRTAVVSAGGIASLHRFAHRREEYELSAAAWAEREALLAGRRARILVRPDLRLHGEPIALALLEGAELVVTAADADGTPLVQTVRNPKLEREAEFVHEIAVPERLRQVTVQLRGRVRSLSTGRDVALETRTVRFQLNGIDATPTTGCALLRRSAEGYGLEVLGRNGEAKAGATVRVRLQHRDYVDPVDVALRTDAQGRIALGELAGISTVRVDTYPEELGAFELRAADRTYPRAVRGSVGETLRVPWMDGTMGGGRDALALLEVRGGVFVRDAFEHLAVVPGFVELRGLPPGDYELWLKRDGVRIEVQMSAGAARDGLAVGRDRWLPTSGRHALQVTRLAQDGDEVVVALANATPETRVHLTATRYVAAADPFFSLVLPRPQEAEPTVVEHGTSSYHAGRTLGDEFRYVLERRYTERFPGNMLPRPGLLLNPWALETTALAVGLGGGEGGRFGGRRGGVGRGPSGGAGPAGAAGRPGVFPNLDFLAAPARVHANLRPGADGILRVKRGELGDGHLVHVLAADARDTVYATLALAEQPLRTRERRLEAGLDPERHFTQQRRIEFVAAGASAVVEDTATAATTTYDSLAAVFRLFQALSGSRDLETFAFLLRWPELTAEQKHELYGKHACHEVHLFLHQKDRAFFDAVVRPYLAHKAHKTFLDHWLLEADLGRYLEPWHFDRLNVVERILLARRLPEHRAAVGRAVREAVELQPADQALLDRLFTAALRSGALEAKAAPAPTTGAPAETEGKEDAPAARRARPGAPPAARKEGAEDEKKLADKDALEPAEKAKELMDRAGEVAEEVQHDARLQAEDLERRVEVRQLYRPVEPTRQYVESNWWHRPLAEHGPDLIRANAFWADYALAADGVPFVSSRVAHATGSVAEMLVALAVLDLPFQPAAHAEERAERRLTLRPGSPLLLVREELRPADPAGDQAPILIGQNLFRLDDRWRYEAGERLDRFVTGELLVDVAYGCQVVLTNPTSTPRKLELLLQVPAGAVPLQDASYTRGRAVQLGAYESESFEYAFYFPAPGRWPHFPAHVARDGRLLAAAAPAVLNVVPTPTRVDTASWQHVAQEGSDAEVFAFLEQANLQRVDLGQIEWRLRDREFFAGLLERLRRRHVYAHALWAWGIAHGDAVATREYLAHDPGFVARCGPALRSPLLDLDPVERHGWQIVEFEPLFLARAHRFGPRRVILNPDLARHYLALLDLLAYRPQLGADDWLLVTCHLLLQDRVAEALQAFARVDPGKVATRLQYEYLQTYLAFYREDLEGARRIAERHRDHPVPRWRARFREALNQIAEAEGKPAAPGEPGDRMQWQSGLAASEPALDLAIAGRRITIRHRNLDRVTLSYYPLDVEFSFSTNPFVQQGTGAFTWVRPRSTAEQALAAGAAETVLDLPAEYHNQNVLVEVRGGGVVRRQAWLATSLDVQTQENYGQLRLTHATTQRPLSKVYVKVYARLPGGAVRFHKDGYTDLRGRFDYASVSESGTERAERYAILMLSEQDGAAIREVAPPAR
ncbi:MAG: hypothetical protein IT458_03655 [Planctomycetes bacterium]|nr:hypothetical protein [Planctomycetota bacterium]